MTVVVGVLAAALAGFLELGPGGRAMPREFFLVMLAVAPIGLMILLSLLYRPRRP